MVSKIVLGGRFLVGMVAASGLLGVDANGDPLASPSQQPIRRVTAPVISGKHPEIYRSEGEQGDITPSDIPGPLPVQQPDSIYISAKRDLGQT